MNPGLYDTLLTVALEQDLQALADPRLWEFATLDPGDSHAVFAQFLEHLLANALAQFRGAEAVERQRRLVQRIVAVLAEELREAPDPAWNLATPLRRLLAVQTAQPGTAPDRPDTPLARSALLTGTRLDPSLSGQLRKEIATADRVDILCSFIRWSGLRLVLDELRTLTSRPSESGPRLRVITTTYMGATDPRAVEVLAALPQTEVRVSYDTERTRLHAKAYLFHRETGFGSAYVGSANLSRAALSEGLEWTTKLSGYELPYLWGKIVGTFETYWQDAEFQPYSGSAPERLREAIQREAGGVEGSGEGVQFDLRPFPFQEEILDILAAEREVQDKRTHLVVAATGTGKTMIAAFDYARVARAEGRLPTLLFVAHREEILRQAQGAFRAVLRDQNLGDVLVAGSQPAQQTHLFCSIQSYNSRGLSQLPRDAFDYVVVDEFHHAAAPSYRELLDHVRPRILLGLTATPERSDGLDVLRWFGGRASAEIRLPDAINRRLLCPFQYFGVSDSVDLSGLQWQRGGYKVSDLDRVYTGNDLRAQLVLNKVHELLVDIRRARGLGFCVSQAHAEFMARFFTQAGVPSQALTAESPSDLRQDVQNQLRQRSLNFLFVVDLYNAGVDIPEIDTVLFLRPTESLTVFLQQLGRGLRLHPDKDCLTVLDFIGAHRREFRFAARLRAMGTQPGGPLLREIEGGFPHLPAGCAIRLERVAQQRVLDNVREAVRLVRPRLLASLRELAGTLGRPPGLGEALEALDCPLAELLKRGLWSQLLADAGLGQPVLDPDAERLAKGIQRVAHVECAEQIRVWLAWLDQAERSAATTPGANGPVAPVAVPGRGERELEAEEPVDAGALDPAVQWERAGQMLHVSLWDEVSLGWSLDEAQRRLGQNRSALADLREVLRHRLAAAPTHPSGQLPRLSGPLTVHAPYTRAEVLVGLGYWSLARRPTQREGVLHLPGPRIDAFFVTLQKTEANYSPTTMYEDYLISPELFHWQSQSGTSVTSATGQRYLRHRERGYTPLLFVREAADLATGGAAPFHYLGPCEYVSHTGSRPISIVWKLRYPVPARLFRTMARQNVG
ncbi:MAG: DUF3427 domain-containing protein [Planctomycetaceae bacterium]